MKSSHRGTHKTSGLRQSVPRFALRQRWPWLAVAGVLLVALAWGAFRASQGGLAGRPGVNSGPRLEFEETFYDFGEVPLNQYVEHNFVYRNVGDQPLIIQQEPEIELVEGC